VSQTFQLIEDQQQKLNLRRPGHEDVNDVRIRRSFPWSKPGQFVSVRSSDGKELLLIDDVNELDSEMRSKIESWLSRYSFIPRITRIDEVDVRFGYQQWKVQTDRGPAEFRVQEREDIRFLNDGRFSVKDADGNVYEMTRLDQLDPHSRDQLESLL
jgi:Domain of unknown function (DUF1854)